MFDGPTQGRFTYEAGRTQRPPRVRYQGVSTPFLAEKDVSLLILEASTIRPTTRVLKRQSVTFSGQRALVADPLAGKLIELQVVLSGRWQTFRTVGPDANGAWTIRYRFRSDLWRPGTDSAPDFPRRRATPSRPGTQRPDVRSRGVPVP